MALAASHQQQPLDRRFPIAASELPTTTQPLPLLLAVFRSRAILGSHRRPSCMAALAANHQQQRPVDRRFPIAASKLPTPPQPPPLLAAVLRSRAPLARFAARLAWRLSSPALAAALRPPLPDRSLRAAARRRNRCHFSQWCFAAEHSLARVAARFAGGSRRQPSAAARGPLLPDLSLRAAAVAATAATSRSGASWSSSSGSLRCPSCMAALAASHQPRPLDRRFPIAASAPTPPQPLPLLAAVFCSRASRFLA